MLANKSSQVTRLLRMTNFYDSTLGAITSPSVFDLLPAFGKLKLIILTQPTLSNNFTAFLFLLLETTQISW